MYEGLSRRLTSFWRPSLVFVLVFAFCAAVPAQIFHDPRRKAPVGFSVDLQYSLDTVASIVQKVAEDTIIRGTKIYSKDSEIDDATTETSSKAFSDTASPGKMFYKVKTRALSPDHFPGSNDMGTVTVRYIVQVVTPQRTRLLIDAVFVEDARRTRCFSDGSVEAAEYAEIMQRLKALDAPKSAGHPAGRPAVLAQQSVGLQETLAQEQARLAEAQAAEQKLEQRVKQLEFNTMGRVKSEGVPLKAAAYDHSATLLILDKGEKVTVLTTTKYWYRIRRAQGDEGWIYYVFLEPLQ